MAPFHCYKLLIKMKCVSFFIVLAISLNLFCLVEATFYQCSTDIHANSNGTDRGVLGKLWVHVGTLVFGCTSINNTSADHVVASRYEDTDVDYQDENEEDQEDQNIGKSVSILYISGRAQAIEYLGSQTLNLKGQKRPRPFQRLGRHRPSAPSPPLKTLLFTVCYPMGFISSSLPITTR